MSLASHLFVFSAIASLAISPAFALNIDTTVREKDQEKISAANDAVAVYTPMTLADATEHALNLSADTKIARIDKAQYKLSQGCILLHTDEATFISTRRANIAMKAGATVVVSAKEEVTRIMNLSDRQRDSVLVVFGNYHIALNPGEELAVVCSQAADVDKAANEFVIRYRNAQRVSVSREYDAVLFEFSLADAMRHCLIFKQLSESPREEDHALLKEIIKTVAAVNTMFAKSRVKYTHGDTTVANNQTSSKRLVLKNNKKKQNLAYSDESNLRTN